MTRRKFSREFKLEARTLAERSQVLGHQAERTAGRYGRGRTGKSAVNPRNRGSQITSIRAASTVRRYADNPAARFGAGNGAAPKR